MKRREFLTGLVATPLFVQTTVAPPGMTAVSERKAMVSFSLPNLDGKLVRSGDFAGNVVILRFWATW
jgi:hypothetical protein